MTQKALLTRFATRIINTPLLIHPDKLNVILGAVGDRIGLEAPSGGAVTNIDMASPAAGRDQAPMDHAGIAVIPVYDSLVFRAMGLDALSGLTSYEDIRGRFQAARRDPSAKGILFNIHSPGGEGAGLFDLVDEIYQARGEKPIMAVINEMAFSAAYAIASAADQIFLPRTGQAGSIGVVSLHVDQSGSDAQKGMKYTYVYAGAHKVDFSPHAPLGPGPHAGIQALVNEDYELFIDTVARNRGMAPSRFRETEAAIFQGGKAVDAGLADGVMPFSRAMEHMVSKTRKGGNHMDQNELQTRLEALITTPGLDAEAALGELGFAPKPGAQTDADPDKIRAEASEAATAEALGRVNGVLDLCALANMPEMASPLIRENLSVEDARKRILDARAEQGKGNEIFSTVSPLSTGEVNPLLADARNRAEKAGKA